MVTLGLLFEAYDVSMLTAALKHIAEDLHIAEKDLPLYLSLIRFGALPALLLAPLTDRFGRRPLFLTAIVGISIGTFADE